MTILLSPSSAQQSLQRCSLERLTSARNALWLRPMSMPDRLPENPFRVLVTVDLASRATVGGLPSPDVAGYAKFLPAVWQERVDQESASTWWRWRGHEVHVIRRVNPEAPVRVLLIHGTGGHSAALWPIASLLPENQLDLAAIDLPLCGETTSPDPAAVRYEDWVSLVCDFVRDEEDARPLARVLPRGLARRRIPMSWVAALSKMSRDPELSRLCAADPRGGGAAVPLGFLTSFMTYRYVPPEQMTTPVTLVHPAKDAWTPVEVSTRWLSRVAAPAGLVMLRECGHFPIEDPGLADLVRAVERVACLAQDGDETTSVTGRAPA